MHLNIFVLLGYVSLICVIFFCLKRLRWHLKAIQVYYNNVYALINLANTEVSKKTPYYPFGMIMEGEWQNIVNEAKNKYL